MFLCRCCNLHCRHSNGDSKAVFCEAEPYLLGFNYLLPFQIVLLLFHEFSSALAQFRIIFVGCVVATDVVLVAVEVAS